MNGIRMNRIRMVHKRCAMAMHGEGLEGPGADLSTRLCRNIAVDPGSICPYLSQVFREAICVATGSVMHRVAEPHSQTTLAVVDGSKRPEDCHLPVLQMC